MFLLLAIALVIAWLLGFMVFHVASFAIHILLLLALAGIVAHLVHERASTAP